MNPLERRTLRSIIFDMDGVIIDTCPLHEKAWKEAGIQLSYTWPERINFKKDVFGTVSKDSATLLFGMEASSDKELIHLKDIVYENLLNQHVEEIAVDGVVQFMERLKSAGYELAIATSARPEEADLVINRLQIKHLLDTVVDVSQAKYAKPHPDIYLKALAKLNRKADECIAFEDSVSGCQAVIAAGIPCVVIKTTMDDHKIEKSELRIEQSIDNFLPGEISKLSFVMDLAPNLI